MGSSASTEAARRSSHRRRLFGQHIGGAGAVNAALIGIAAAAVLLAQPTPAAAKKKKKKAVIVIYDGFGTPKAAKVWGRVLEDRGFRKPKKKERWYRRLKRSYRLLESNEIPNARLELKIAGITYSLQADGEGLFSLRLTGITAGTHAVKAKLKGGRRFRVIAGKLSVLPAKGGVAVISDIDDTVLKSGVKNKLKLIKKVLLSNAHHLKSYKYAPPLYRVFAARGHPIVFVSGSPINLYTRLRAFFKLRRFPRAPLLLKNLGTSRGSDSLFGQKKYKLKRIGEAIKLLPKYKLILIGDSGEKDPEIYAAIKRKHGARVLAILIHNVSDASAAEARFSGQLLFDSYKKAARHLRSEGLISAAQTKKIERQKR